MPFPNPETMFKPGVSGLPRGAPKPAIGKRRARKLKLAVAVAEAIHGPAPVFQGDLLAFLRGAMRGELAPDPARMAAAVALARFEYPTLSAQAVAVTQPERPAGLRIDVSKLTNDQRALLLAIVQSGAVKQADGQAAVTIARRTIDAPALAAPASSAPDVNADTSSAELRASITKAEAERDAIEIARAEAERAGRRS